ncbi:MAG: AAA family ATPase, partial [Anaerolineae bacterium]|nr:AAA family ATPase [Anaerolineae bacterium]
MTIQHLLQTKLYIPPPRPELVPRPRLLERLNKGLTSGCKLTLISAPAGYGKTTLVSSWIRRLETGDWRLEENQSLIPNSQSPEFVWLSLDEDDNDPQQFFSYLAAAMNSLPEVRTFLPQLLQSPQPLPGKDLMKAFVTDLATVSVPVLFILDDYHVIESVEIDAAMAFLLDHTPPHLHLVVATRSDPGFPISRLRARAELTELRMGDLRFTDEEAASFLKDRMGIALSPDQFRALENRTEGWIAGLQMAALSMQNLMGSELEAFVANFTGSHRFVLDYLIEEALSQQPEPVRNFLLATSILDRLSEPLCDAVRFGVAETSSSVPGPAGSKETTDTGQANGQTLLQSLERNNLFVVPLDDERRWYRYHHLFADVLRAYALTKQPTQVAEWHRRAGQWFAQQGALPDAIRHCLAAKDFTQAAHLIELIRPTIDGIYQITTWLGWVQSLPEALIRERPVLNAGYGWALLENGDLAAGEARLQAVERSLEIPSAEMVVADDAQWQILPASLANARAYHALALGDVAGAVQYARQALDFLPDEDHHWRLVALSLLGLTYWINGDLAAATLAFADLTESNLKADKVVDAIATGFVQADLAVAQGRLNEAEQTLQQILREATRQGEPLPLGTSDLYRLLGYLAWERGDFETARQHL